jgi:hypothetical protein
MPAVRLLKMPGGRIGILPNFGITHNGRIRQNMQQAIVDAARGNYKILTALGGHVAA